MDDNTYGLMKYMFLSDIHGSIGSLRRALDFYTDARCDMLLLLGDIINLSMVPATAFPTT